jgi:L-seryl-tRNA(Ser) seleniumtransferase
MVGGGSLPEEGVETRLLSIPGPHADAVARSLRLGSPPVVARIAGGALLLDPRTVDPLDDAALLDALRRAIPAAG